MHSGISVRVEIDAPPTAVWEHISDVRRHATWMTDAVRVRLIDVQPGPGQRFECDTRIGPFRVTDRMTITEWAPPERMGVRHSGVVTGTGAFVLNSIDAGRRTRFAWTETLRLPWWLGGPFGAWAARPLLRWIWRRNLRALRAEIEA